VSSVVRGLREVRKGMEKDPITSEEMPPRVRLSLRRFAHCIKTLPDAGKLTHADRDLIVAMWLHEHGEVLYKIVGKTLPHRLMREIFEAAQPDPACPVISGKVAEV